ncbi:MAG: polyphosphate kinase 1 [Actinobacteria bacterium]|nr:polyphosphate kinase 1 [Actinomycetota bacterium]
MAIETEQGRDLSDPALYVNRELSWLDFNARVLALAADPATPLLERCKFLAIFSNNLDEFFMVRVAGIQDALSHGRSTSTPDQMPRDEVLGRIAESVRHLVATQYRLWLEEIQPALMSEGIRIVHLDDLPAQAANRITERFSREIEPVLTPLAVGRGMPFPFISPLSLNIGVIATAPATGESRFARVKVPGGVRLLDVDGWMVPMEELITANLERIFPGMRIDAATRFRVTRDADFSISDEADDLIGAVEAELRRRRFGEVVRLEVEEHAPERIVEELRGALGIGPRDVFSMPAPLDMTVLFDIARLDRPHLRDRPWRPRTQPRLRSPDRTPLDIFAVIRERDVLVHHPYDDFTTSVEEFVEQAVEDPNVLAIKQTLYRTSGDAPIVPALTQAAEAGKQVVCLVELQARFDEERNIRWARSLERAGVHVVYGLSGLKTHGKLALVMRREGDRVRRYVHIGTGNYHPTTARLYTDFGLFTCHDGITADVAALFNSLTGFAQPPSYAHVLVAPAHVRDGLLAEIDRVVSAHRAGTPGRIEMKMNAIIDGPIIEALYGASQAGVPVDLVVRGICGLRPGIEGVSERIRVVSIVGQFLEHSRVFVFTSGDESRYWMGSADLMARNLDHRVEVITPVFDPLARVEIRAALDVMLADTALAWELDADGRWSRVALEPGVSPVNSQLALMARAVERAERRVGARDANR